MNSKRRPIPLEVSTWMDKDLTLRKITANSRLLTNDTRQNIVLSRQFFSNLLTLSYARYRKMSQYDFDKKLFLKNQRNKSESMPGFRPRLDQITMGMNRNTPSRIQSTRKTGNPLICPSAQSFFSRSETKSDPTFNRRQQPLFRQVRTAQPMRAESITPLPDITPVINSATPTNQRTSIRPQMSRETLNRLAQPKCYRSKPTVNNNNNHVRSNIIEETTTPEDIFGKIEHESDFTSQEVQPIIQEKPKSAADDKRFHHLVGAFTKIHEAQTSNLQTVKSIVRANPSLQDEEGQWKVECRSVISRKVERDHSRQMLADKLHNKQDVFLIDVGA
ncbi:unnamed protein product [Rotaria sp. Silwood2]|nr:unnamed protein product [Rotaria sp. Silwood2]CAF3118977.1 unnamed protein product [Rotaria sp. Silwood2]CAF3864489.1 unnamed protein product [Rotaria sp. Silwood2]CAF4034605.1 unnamed protein product [Rotaria sp. Silwood2]